MLECRAQEARVRLKLLRCKEVGSTNDIAYRLGEQGAKEWTVVVSEVQTKGRGRKGKTWESAKGGLWFSVLLRLDVAINRLSLLQFFAANATRHALHQITGVDVQLKWPNDLVLDRQKKLGGILLESKILDGKLLFTIIGIGLNVNQTNASIPQGAISLFQITHRRYDRLKLLKGIIGEMSSNYQDFLEHPSRILEEWWENCIHKDKMVQIHGPKGKIEGISKSLSPEGALILETGPGESREFSEGTLRILTDW